MKFALLSHVLPPSSSGQAVVISRLLRDLEPSSYCLLSLKNYDVSSSQENYIPRLPGKYYRIPDEIKFPSRILDFSSILRIIRLTLSLLLRCASIARILYREKCNSIIVCSGNLIDIPAGFLASRLTGVSFIPYYFDYYSYQRIGPLARSFSRRIEPKLLKKAECIIVPNEFLQYELLQSHNVDTTVIHNPNDSSGVEKRLEYPWPLNQSEIRIVYTGAVYQAHYDAFYNLINAIHQLNRSDIKLHIYTSQPSLDLKKAGITGPVVLHTHKTPIQVTEIQRTADILFLPLAFKSPIHKIITTSAPGKMGEYLASGRPILVHAPADSYVSWYFKEYSCGLVVDNGEPELLAQALKRMLENYTLRHQMIKRAQERARIDFDLEVAQSKFLYYINQ